MGDRVNIKALLPSPGRAAQEIIVTLVGVLGAAWIISKIPAAQKFVQQNAVTVKDGSGNILWG